MHSFTVLGYTYEADVHCVACATDRFGDPDKEGLEDREGNSVHPIFVQDCEGTERCGDCGEVVYEVGRTGG